MKLNHWILILFCSFNLNGWGVRDVYNIGYRKSFKFEVSKGDPVLLIAKKGSIEIKMKAIALEDGSVGSFIKIKVLQGKDPILAKIESKGIVVYEE
jgi:hypothetical protein